MKKNVLSFFLGVLITVSFSSLADIKYDLKKFIKNTVESCEVIDNKIYC
jgi:hypothetical protein